jgi:hypothetical protein
MKANIFDTRQLLAFSHRQVLRLEGVDLGALALGLGKMLGRVIGEDIALSMVHDDDLWPVRADRGQLEQVLMNLVINALVGPLVSPPGRDVPSLGDGSAGLDCLIGAFLIGAYQEILGDLHNLFGDTNAVHVSTDARGEVVLDAVIKGDTVREVLNYVQFSSDQLVSKLRRDVEAALREGRLGYEETGRLLRFYEEAAGVKVAKVPAR